ncbi:PEGA domain-containing protein [Candidatus Microgenomates bacterium]|nr:PEGA domain-containing protein [Candidatus Microgenomates bacterium]
MNRRNLVIVLTVLAIFLLSVVVIVVARGYQLDFKNATLAPTGILVATSDPDGAEVFVNGKLITATNNTINLAPGKYLVKITKDGFTPWEKTVTIKPEEVFKTSAFLFPNLPELRPITLTGAQNPLLSPDSTKIAYQVASASAEKNGLWILDMARTGLPAGIFASSDSRQIYQTASLLPLTISQISWSADSKELLASTSSNLTYLLETDRPNPAPDLLNSAALSQTLAQWTSLETTRYLTQTSKLNPILLATLATTSGKLQFSPDENKILYQATASAILPPILTTYLPGSNPAPETRLTQPGKYYVYDTKEDKNYLIENCELKTVNCSWFPSSRHLISFTDHEISIREYDGTNRAIVYGGPFKPGIVYVWPNWSKIVILTSLNDPGLVSENLYTINLR